MSAILAMLWEIQTVDGKPLNLIPWRDRILQNSLANRDLFERTPVCPKAQKGKFMWWQDDENFVDIDSKTITLFKGNLKKALKETK